MRRPPPLLRLAERRGAPLGASARAACGLYLALAIPAIVGARGRLTPAQIDDVILDYRFLAGKAVVS